MVIVIKKKGEKKAPQKNQSCVSDCRFTLLTLMAHPRILPQTEAWIIKYLGDFYCHFKSRTNLQPKKEKFNWGRSRLEKKNPHRLTLSTVFPSPQPSDRFVSHVTKFSEV